MEPIIKLIAELIRRPDLRNHKPLKITFDTPALMLRVLLELGEIEVRSLIILGETTFEMGSLDTPSPPEPAEPLVSSDEDSSAWNEPVDAGNLYMDQELPGNLEPENDLDRIPSPNPYGPEIWDAVLQGQPVGANFNNPILIQAPPREANQELEEIWEENEDEYGWTDLGYFTDEDSYLV